MQRFKFYLHVLMLTQCLGALLDCRTCVFAQEGITAALDAFNQRHSRFKSSRWRWSERQIVPKGGIMTAEVARQRGMPDEAGKHGLPMRDETISFPVELLVRNDWLKLHSKTLDFQSDTPGQFHDYLSSYDGTRSKKLHGSGTTQLSGTLFKNPASTDLPTFRLMPFRLFVCPLVHHGGPIDPARLQVHKTKSDTTDEPDVSRVLLHITDGINEYWLDREREFAVVRWREVVPGRGLVTEADIEYFKQDEVLIPANWTIINYRAPGSGLVSRKIIARVDEARPDAELTQNDFRLDFPPLTRVYDEAAKTEFVVKADGTMAQINGDDGYLTPTEILRRHTDAAKGQFKKTLIFSLFSIGSAAAAILFVVRSKGSR